MASFKLKEPKFAAIPAFTRSAHYIVDMPLYQLENRIQDFIKEDSLDLDPDFQRTHVWNETQQVRYVEYLLRGGMSARVLYFNHPGWQRDWKGQMVIVDGKQRLEALRKFLRDELPIFGYTRSQFTDTIRLVDGIKIAINDLPTRKEVLQWYLDLNDGGVAHTSAEIEKVRKLLVKEGG